jgi:phage baseplate assembly protein W
MAIDFGADVSTFPDLDVRGTEISDVRSVVEASLRRLITPNGSLEYDRDFGYDLRDLLHDDLTETDLRRHEMRVALELEKDERVLSAEASIAFDEERPFVLLVRVTAVLVDDREFSFTGAISTISAELLAA